MSALTGEGLDELGERIAAEFERTLRDVELLVPFSEGGTLSELHDFAGDLEREDTDEGVRISARLPSVVAERYDRYAVNGNGRPRARPLPHPRLLGAPDRQTQAARARAGGGPVGRVSHPPEPRHPESMNDHPAPGPRRRPGAVAIVASTLLAVASLTLFAAGGVLLWADGQKDDQGYLTTSSERFSTRHRRARDREPRRRPRRARAPPSATARSATSGSTCELAGDEPVFIGIARTSDVDDYLRGTAHTIVRDVDTAVPRRLPRPARRPPDRAARGRSDLGRVVARRRPADLELVTSRRRLVGRRHERRRLARRRRVACRRARSCRILVPAGWTLIGGGALVLLIAGGVLFLSAAPPAFSGGRRSRTRWRRARSPRARSTTWRSGAQ